MSESEIDRLKSLQRERGLGDVHLVSLGEYDFSMAHTDEERASGMDLHDCELHQWLKDCDGPPHPLGTYTVTPHEPDAYSEPLGAAPWDFEPLGAA